MFKRYFRAVLVFIFFIGANSGWSSQPEEIELRSNDNTPLRAVYYSADNPSQIRAGLVFVHGMQSHSGWYVAGGTGDFLAKDNIASIAFDRRGSGASGGRRGHAESAKKFLEDLDAAVEELKWRLPPGAPIHILANCFGSRVAFPYVRLHPEIKSLLVTSPAVAMNPEADYSSADKAGIFARSALYMGQQDHLLYEPTPLKDEFFVTQGPWLDWIQDDALSLRHVTIQFLKSAKTLTEWMDQSIPRLKRPLLIMLASEDQVVVNEEIRKNLYLSYRGPKKLVEFPSDHYLDFDRSKDKYQRTVLDWINQHSVKN